MSDQPRLIVQAQLNEAQTQANLNLSLNHLDIPPIEISVSIPPPDTEEAKNSLASFLTEMKDMFINNFSFDFDAFASLRTQANHARGFIDYYNNRINSGVPLGNAFYTGVANHDAQLAAYLRNLNGHATSVNQYQNSLRSSMISSSIKTAALSTGLNMGMNLIFSAAIQGVTKLLGMYQETIDKANQMTSDFLSNQKSSQSNLSSLSSLSSEFSILSEGVDINGNNINLSTEQYERYKEVLTEIVSLSPSIVNGYTAEGLALVNNKSALTDAIAYQRELMELRKQEYLLDGEKVIQGADHEMLRSQKELLSLKDDINKTFFHSNKVTGDTIMKPGFSEALKEINGLNPQNMGTEELLKYGDAIIEKVKEHHLLSASETQELQNQITLLDIKNEKLDDYSQKKIDYLNVFASSESESSWHDQIDPQFADDFNVGLNQIAKNHSFSISDMQVATRNLGEAFVLIQDQIPTDKIEALQSQFDSGKISAQDYASSLNAYAQKVNQLADETENTNPGLSSLAEMLRSIAIGYEHLAELSTQVNYGGFSKAQYEVAAFASELDSLSGVYAKVSQGQVLNYQEKQQLLSIYPELAASIKNVAGGWTLETKALLNSAAASKKEQASKIQAEINKSYITIASTQARINIYQKEINALRQLSAASSGTFQKASLATKSLAGQIEITLLKKGITSMEKSKTDLNSISFDAAPLSIPSSGPSMKSPSIPSTSYDPSYGKDTIMDKYNQEKEALEYQVFLSQQQTKNVQKGSKQWMAEMDHQFQLYQEMQAKSAQQAQILRSKDATLYAKEIQDLSKEWWGSEDEKKQIHKDKFEQRFSISKQYIEDRNFYGDWGEDSEIEAWQRVLKWMKEYCDEGILTYEAYMEQYHEISKKIYTITTDSAKKAYTDSLKKEKEAVKDILDLTVKLIKKEKEDQIKGLEEKVEKYSEYINLQKESLKLREKEDDYQEGLSDKVNDISKLKAQADLLALDDSRQAQSQRAELLDQIAEKQKELNHYQHDEAVDLAENALDKELSDFKTTKQKEIEEIKNQLAQSGLLTQEAMMRMQTDGANLYTQLLEYNGTYGDGISTTITNAWDTATEALKRYGTVLETITGIDADMDKSDGKDKDKTGPWSKFSAGELKDLNQMAKNAKRWNSATPKERKELEDNSLALGSKHGFYRESSGLWYDRDGKVILFNQFPIDTFHTGLEKGFVGNRSSARQNEFLSILKTGELIINKEQQLKFMDQLQNPNHSASLANHKDTGNFNYTIENLDASVVIKGNADASVMDQIRQHSKEVSNLLFTSLKQGTKGMNLAPNGLKINI